MVSFERVFEVFDLPHDIVEKKDARPLPAVNGELVFDNVKFTYKVDGDKLLKDVKRYGAWWMSMQFSLRVKRKKRRREMGVGLRRRLRKPYLAGP
jgi:ABC-type multidrug transport system fused ATPase/permease subunit